MRGYSDQSQRGLLGDDAEQLGQPRWQHPGPAHARIHFHHDRNRARTADLALTVTGDERMAEELKTLTEDLDKDQPLSGDSIKN